MENRDTADYLAFMIRLWREDQRASWRATVENPHTGERHGFSGLDELYAFIESRTRQAAESEEDTADEVLSE